jgi:predicted 3-demethylubiquinone-9 3-methyltransferase (glyoxalase superfamily)
MKDNIATFLWFDNTAAEAAALYARIFPNCTITESSAMSTSFTIGTQRYIAFNGGPHFKLDSAVSLFISCDSQAEVDVLWKKFLAEGATESKCGWLVDKFGLSWQIIPNRLYTLMTDPDPKRTQRVVAAMMQMAKIDLATLEAAHAG